MNKIIKIYAFLLFIVFFLSKTYSIPNSDSTNTCKERLPNQINSYQPVLVPVLTPDGIRLYFDRKSHPNNTNKTKDFDDIWYSDKLSQGMWSEPKNVSEINTSDSDVLFWISPDGRIGIVNGIYSDRDIIKKTGFSFTEYDGDKWSKPQALNIKNYYNDSLNFYAHLSADGKILIMAISRKDAVGGLDFYFSFFNEQSKEWSSPMNIGKDINTKGDEEAPYLAYDNKTLYFSSNGYKGEGEQDLYISRRLDDSWKKWSKPQNLGKVINTKYSEQGLYLTALGDSAVIVSYDTVSKRKGLYWICLPKEIQPEPYIILKGYFNFDFIQDKIQTVKIIINDKEENCIKFGKMKNYALVLPDKKNYEIRFETAGYGTVSYELDLRNVKQSQIIEHDFIFHKQEKIKDKFVIYFEHDSYNLNEDSKKILNEIISENLKNRKIEIFGHTDEIGTDDYNMNLSKKRAKQVQDYLINKGLKRRNIEILALGEKEPISKDFTQNRRVEILIK